MNRRIGLIAIAVVLALVGTGAVYIYAHNADKRAVDATRAAHVLIAQRAVPVGTTWNDAVKKGYLAEDKIPVNTAPDNAVGSLSAAIPVDETATAEIASGQVVTREMFATKSVTTGLLAVPKDKMALTVTLSTNADVAGFTQSGSEVAIFSTYKIAKDSASKVIANQNIGGGTDLYTTKLLLPRVSVIATSQGAPSSLSGSNSANGSSSTTNVLVTLAVTQQEAERIILSQQIGSLYLALLSDSSVTAPDTGVYNIVSVAGTRGF